jgi:nanoRNase/pAp phosphatase (c-di-AMP/oligoRNAs hydrolase)
MFFKVDFRPDVVIYHDRCMDGFTAAYAVWAKFRNEAERGDIKFVPGNHALDRDDIEYWKDTVKDKKVVILDFSFERRPLLEMHEAADELIVLDHHKSAEEKLGDLDFCHFRQDMSGALIAWHAFNEEGELLFEASEFHPKIYATVPNLFKYVSDRDLWTWELEYSREINAYIRAQEKTFDEWHSLCIYLETQDLGRIATYGSCMVQCVNSLVASICTKAEVWKLNGVNVIAVNSSELQSEVCALLLKHESSEGVSGCYSIEKGKMTWSLRSKGEVDVSAIAAQFEGGGHIPSAGFSVSLIGSNNKVMYGVRSVTSG